MGVLSLLRISRRRTDRESQDAPVAQPSPPRAAGASHGRPGARAAAASAVLGDLTTLEQRYGAGVAPAAVRLRGAVLLHRAGRKNEAWVAFNRLLADPALGGSQAIRPIIQSEVYSRMRMAHEREGCQNAAITPAVLSYVLRAQFYERQGRRAELDVLCSDTCFDNHFAPLLERARLAPLLPVLRALAGEHLRALPSLDVAALTAALEALRVRPPGPAASDPGRGDRAKQR